ncbi:MAG: sulfatase-like hydrolase/transferase [Planctomycetota bacterium]|nr:sulfatase-like hydrolase/transferase [Planctomycetota bacterium]
MPNGRPNILFLMSDEHRADVTGYAGDPVIRTPTLDHLAATGVVFTNCYTPSPVCVPCRQSLASGQLPRTSGVECYGQDLPPFSMTWAKRFSQYAYGTVCCGKLHHDGPDQMQGWKRRIGANTRVTDSYVDGFLDDEAARFTPLGDGKWSDTKEVLRAGIGRGATTHVGDEIAALGATRLIESRFLDLGGDRVNHHRPTLLKLSFNRPHYPYLTEQGLFSYYLNRVTPYLEQTVFDHPFLSQRQVRPGIDATPRELRRATAAYYGMIEEIDRDYGSVLNALEAVGEDLDNWIIVYTSDHGEMLGQHGIWEKQKFFEASAKVPLIIRWPQRFQPRVVTENVNLCDLFATLCDLADIPLPNEADTVDGRGLDSRSLVPLMDGDTSAWNNESISQFGATNLMIKRDALKYHLYTGDACRDQPEVLFDLKADPSESRNLINESGYADAVTSFRTRCAELGFGPNADPNYRNAGYR